MSISVDWLEEFERKFSGNPMIAALKESKFHGKVTINFCGGSPNTTHLEWCVRPYSQEGALVGIGAGKR